MNYTNIIIELLLFAFCLSLVINATHIAFQKEMALNWLYEWLESKFKREVSFSEIFTEGEDINGKYKQYESINISYGYKFYKKVYKSGVEMVFYEKDKLYVNKYRNSKGLLYIAKPIYACASCMPSIWSLPLLTILVWWKVIFIAIFAVVISTLLRDKLFE